AVTKKMGDEQRRVRHPGHLFLPFALAGRDRRSREAEVFGPEVNGTINVLHGKARVVESEDHLLLLEKTICRPSSAHFQSMSRDIGGTFGVQQKCDALRHFLHGAEPTHGRAPVYGRSIDTTAR